MVRRYFEVPVVISGLVDFNESGQMVNIQINPPTQDEIVKLIHRIIVREQEYKTTESEARQIAESVIKMLESNNGQANN